MLAYFFERLSSLKQVFYSKNVSFRATPNLLLLKVAFLLSLHYTGLTTPERKIWC